jgi:hypothetical protein
MSTLREAAQQALKALIARAERGDGAPDTVAALRAALAQEEQEPVACECHRCIKEKDLRDPSGMLPLSMSKMILCAECGNKRCPKASDHMLACTGSNELGQSGSVYAHPPRRDALAQQEPTVRIKCTVVDNQHPSGIPFEQWVNAPRREWKGLSDAEVLSIHQSLCNTVGSDYRTVARAVEAKLKEKNA